MHLSMLRHIVWSEIETALIIEDDVDWSVDIKNQIEATASAVRNLTSILQQRPLNATANDTTAWTTSSTSSQKRGWDVLWLGHCGEYWLNPDYLSSRTVSWTDNSTIPRRLWAGSYGNDALDQLPDGQRHIYPTQGAICSFAYAVTREGAKRLLIEADKQAEEAYDVSLQRACQRGGGWGGREGEEDGLNCLSVVDELFHHYKPAESFGESSDIAVQAAGEREEARFETEPGETRNIVRSARCEALFGSTCNGLPEDWRNATAAEDGQASDDMVDAGAIVDEATEEIAVEDATGELSFF